MKFLTWLVDSTPMRPGFLHTKEQEFESVEQGIARMTAALAQRSEEKLDGFLAFRDGLPGPVDFDALFKPSLMERLAEVGLSGQLVVKRFPDDFGFYGRRVP